MKNLSCYVLAISALLFACESSSNDAAGAGGAKTSGGTGGTTTATGSGGSSTATDAGGTTSTGTAGATSTVAAETSGVDGASLATDLAAEDLAKLCSWIEGVMGLARGAADDDVYVSGTWFSNQCPDGDPVKLWGSPRLCADGIDLGNGVGCDILTVSLFESCVKAIKTDLCLLATASACNEFNSCFPLAVED